VVVENGPLTIRLQVTSDALRAELIRGRDDPPLGWVSRRFDRKQAIWCARWHGRVPAGTAWTTLFEIEMSPRPPAGEGRTKGMAVS